jgi:hypothetical protein
MKRNWDIIRDILVALESKEDFSAMHPERIPAHAPELVSYHLLLLKEAGLILAECRHDAQGLTCCAASLTWAGHEFLDTIRRDTVWNAIKRTARERGVDLSFDTIKAVARKVIEGMLL